MKTGILFDLDGTLLDTLEDLADSVNYTMAQLGYPARTLPEIRAFVGNGAWNLLSQAVPSGADVESAYQAFKAYYDHHCRIKTRPYPGISDALAELKQEFPIAIVSNKPDSAVKSLCADFFPGILAMGESPDCPRKPAPDMVRKAMDAIGVEQCVYIGDSEVDILTAANAGVPCLSVLWGFRDRELLEQTGARSFCDAPQNLAECIRKLTK